MAAILTFDATGGSTSIIGSVGSYTFPITVASAAGEERLVFICGIMSVPTADFSSVTVDGEVATQVGSDVVGTGGDRAYLSAWRVAGTANTSIDVVAARTGVGDCYGAAVACYRLAGADTVLATATAITNDPSINVNTANNGTVAAAFFAFSGPTPAAAWVGLTERFESSLYGTDIFSGASANITSASTPLAVSLAITPTMDIGVTDTLAAIAVSFNPEAAAASSDENIYDKSAMVTMGGMMG